MTCQRGWGPPHGAGATLGAPVPSRGLGWPPPTHHRAQSLFPRLKPSLLKSSAPRGAGANPPPGEKRGTGVRGVQVPAWPPPLAGIQRGHRYPPPPSTPRLTVTPGEGVGGTRGGRHQPPALALGGLSPPCAPSAQGGLALHPNIGASSIWERHKHSQGPPFHQQGPRGGTWAVGTDGDPHVGVLGTRCGVVNPMPRDKDMGESGVPPAPITAPPAPTGG